VPKGPSFDPQEKRMAIHVEDHPVSYGSFEGTIPPRQYGAGTVIVWDRGTWEPVGDPREGLAKGKLLFKLHGEKLAGLWELVRIAKPGDKQEPWFLFKKRDAWARPLAEYDVIVALPDSVVKKPLGQIEERAPRGGVAPSARTRSPQSAADLPGAVKANLPATLAPQLATLATGVPASGEWSYEIKSTGTGCWPASSRVALASSPATAMTGPPSSKPSPPQSRPSASRPRGSTARSSS
jgi:bifunctional non-homologous end joining protein LigD